MDTLQAIPKLTMAIFHPRLIPGGGSEAFAAWLAEACKDHYRVTLVALGPVDLAGLNAFYGTNLHDHQVGIISLPLPGILAKRFDALRDSFFSRRARKIAPDFDIVVSTYNVMDFGKRGIQCIADFSFDDNLRQKFDGSTKWAYQRSWLRSLYLAFVGRLSGASQVGWKKNLTIANSAWTKNMLKKYFGMDSVVVYPPFTAASLHIPWRQKKDGFVFLGRISPEKQIEKIISIIKQARKTIPSLTLHIVGPEGDKAYVNRIINMCQEHGEWCFLEGVKYGREKIDFISQYKYGISARQNEPFGIAVGEMIQAGNLVFVPAGGGQTEIVNCPDLIYNDEQDAVFKITSIAGSEALQEAIAKSLSKANTTFSPETFRQKIKNLIVEFYGTEKI